MKPGPIKVRALRPAGGWTEGALDEEPTEDGWDYFETLPGEVIHNVFSKPGVRAFTANNGVRVERFEWKEEA